MTSRKSKGNFIPFQKISIGYTIIFLLRLLPAYQREILFSSKKSLVYHYFSPKMTSRKSKGNFVLFQKISIGYTIIFSLGDFQEIKGKFYSFPKNIYWLHHYFLLRWLPGNQREILFFFKKYPLVIPLFFSLGDFQEIRGKFYSHVKFLRLNTVDILDVE